MTRAALFAALVTGAFCSVFALGVTLTTSLLEYWQVMAVGGVSGFCGSLFARLTLGREK